METTRAKGWFVIPGVQDGDRILKQQLRGMWYAMKEVRGKTVLDLGCAEGLIANVAVEQGAAKVYGIDAVDINIAIAKRLFPGDAFSFHLQNLNDEGTKELISSIGRVDIVFMLAILHKLHRPTEVLDWVLANRPGLVVVRTAEKTPGYVQDSRSNNQVFHIKQNFTRDGYVLERITHGSFNEWMGYFRLQA